MVKPRDILHRCAGFQWDKGNAVKNVEKHDVAQTECEQIFFNQPLIVKRDSEHSGLESRYYALGRTDTGRHLFIVFAVRQKLIRVISARDMTRLECERYKQ
jgi:uncharacterized DUF497 family protein